MSTVQPPSTPSDRGPTMLGHPRGLFLLFLVEMWERFSYYGMRGLLILYMTGVIAVHQLEPGGYSNTLQFVEAAAREGAPEAAQTRTLQILIDTQTWPGATAGDVGTSRGEPVLKIRRMKREGEGEDAKWVPDSSDTGGPATVRGGAGAKGEYENSEIAYEVTNPSDREVTCRISIWRNEEQTTPTYFTVNDSPGSVTAKIKPDAQRAEGEQPYRVVVRTNDHDSGRNWPAAQASVLYGWYTGLAYLFPIFGGLIADKLIGTHRSMLAGGLLIALGHVILGISGFGAMAQSDLGMTLFITGLAVIVLGTGHFKPTVSVMVGQLYEAGDPRRDGAFTIFYMGINLGAFICAFVCGTLGEQVGWHWGFGSAAVGMIAGLLLYMWGKPRYLQGIGEGPRPNAGSLTGLFLLLALGVAALFGAAQHFGLLADLGRLMNSISENQTLALSLIAVLLAGILGWTAWFVAQNAPEDRGPVISIFLFMFFNAFFWLAFEQAGSSINLFTEQNTNRTIGGEEIPATWFQSVNAGAIFLMAPFFSAIWTRLGRVGRNPSQPVKIALGLIFLGLGYVFMVWAGKITVGGAAKASMMFVLITYLLHTVGELCLSPTGLSYVTKAAPVRFVSLLMGIWFVSSFIANLGGGLVASKVEAIEKGEITLPWSFGGQADYFFLFVVTSIGVGVLVLLFTPLLKKLLRSQDD